MNDVKNYEKHVLTQELNDYNKQLKFVVDFFEFL